MATTHRQAPVNTICIKCGKSGKVAYYSCGPDGMPSARRPICVTCSAANDVQNKGGK